MPANKNHQQLGFTLVETLVVLFIIGIMFTVTTLNFSDFGRHYIYRFEVEKLAQKIQLMREEAVILNSVFAFSIKGNTVRFFRYQNGRWQSLDNNKPFTPSVFSEKLTLKREPTAKKYLIYPDGTLSPFTLTVYKNQESTYTSKLVLFRNGKHFIYPNENHLKNNSA